MQLSWLDNQDSWVIILLLLLAMTLASEIAYRFGRRLTARAAEASKSHFGAVVGSLLGLLALLLSFTFGMTTQRYEARRLLMIDDTNSVGTLYLRTDLLPEPQRRQLKPFLLQYVTMRTEAIPIQGNDQAFAQAENNSRDLLLKLWQQSRNIAQITPPIKGADAVASSVIDVITSHSRRLSALVNRVPDLVIWMLLAAATAGMSVIGFSAGLGNHRGIPARIMLSVLVCGTIFVMLELDRPRRGLIQVDQAPMIRLAHLIDQDPESHGAIP